MRRLLGSLWLLSWFELYLEIFRHHHVTGAMLRRPFNLIFPSDGGAHPGVWLRAVLVCSMLAPIACVIAVAWHRREKRHASVADHALHEDRFPLPAAAIAFGSLLIGLAAINQAIRRDPLTVDLTLREGNGGFILLGAMLAILGMVLRRRRHSHAGES